MVGEDEVGPGAADAREQLEHGARLVDHAGGGGGLEHRVLAAHVVRAERQGRRLAHARDDVEVRHRGLDHQHVGALLLVEAGLAQGLAGVARVHLVAGAVAELGRAVGRLAERPVEGRGVLHGVGEDTHLFMTALVEGAAHGADAAVHHVARGDDVGAGLGVGERDARQDLERRVVVDVVGAVGPLAQDAAVTMVGVLVDADVGHHDQPGGRVLHGAHGSRHGPVRVGAALAARVLLGGQPEEDHPAEAERASLARHLGRRAHRELVDPGHRRDRPRLAQRLGEEQRQDQVIRAHHGLAHQRSQGGRAPQPPGPLEGVTHERAR